MPNKKAHSKGSIHAKCHTMRYHETFCVVPHSSQWLPHPSILSSCFSDMPSCHALTIHFAHHRSIRPANPFLQQDIPDTHLRQKLSQLPETSHPSCRANCRRGTDECRYRLASSVAIREGRGDRSSRRSRWGRRSSGGRTKVGSA